MTTETRSSMRKIHTGPQGKKTEVKSVLIIHQGALGDFILALPTLGTLRQAFPKARTVIMGFPRILELVEKRFYTDEIISVDQKGMASFFVRGGELDPGLSQFFRTFDLIVAFGKDETGAILSNLHRVCEGRVIHLNLFPPWNERIHMTDHLLRELRRYHFSVEGQNPKLYLTPSDQAWGKGFCRKKGLTDEEKTKVTLLHPGSGGRKKVWPLERFVDLFHYLQKHAGSRIFIILGPAEGTEIQKAFEEIQWDLGSSSPVLLKGLSLLGLASVMEGCRLYIGNDSGITHMAAALDIPTLAIFGPTDPLLWSPRGKKVVVVRKEIECSPCPQEKFFQCQQIECLQRVDMEDVLEGLKQLGMGC